jgi:nicotinamide-nucleotide amidase
MAGAETLSPVLTAALEQRVCTVLEEARRRNLTLATAESCTGGLLASLLTDVEGRGHAFDRGFVVYTNEAKHEVLDIPASLLKDPGPVSGPTAIAMAQGLLEHSRADLCLAVTGFAGPSGPGDIPGLVFFALATRRRATTLRREMFVPVDRGSVRIGSVRVALEMLGAAIRQG